jgi:hypothetical protein
MFSKIIAKFGYAIGCVLALIVFAAVMAFSWITTCGIVWLVAWCFGWTFTWGIATGVWIVWGLLLSIVNTIKG